VTSTASAATQSTSGATPPAPSDRPAAPGAVFTPIPSKPAAKSSEALAAAQAKAKAAQVDASAAVKEAEAKLGRAADKTERKAASLAHTAEAKVDELAHKAGDAIDVAGKEAGKALHAVEKEAGKALHAVEDKTVDLKNAALAGIAQAKEALTLDRATVKEAEDKAATAVDQAKGAASAVKDKVVAGGKDLAALVSEAEDALKGGFQTLSSKTADAADAAAAAAKKPVAPVKKNAQGLTLWTEDLPIGFEPPPGYYVERKPVTPFAKDEPAPVGELLPRLAPSLKAADPVISQLAGTFDELTTYLSSIPSASTEAKSLISTAQLDFDAIEKRLNTIKAEEEAALHKQLDAKRAEFESQIKEREVMMSNELEKREEGWKEVVEDERRRLVENFRERLQKELEVQQEIVNERYVFLAPASVKSFAVADNPCSSNQAQGGGCCSGHRAPAQVDPRD
jgi:mitofilin